MRECEKNPPWGGGEMSIKNHEKNSLIKKAIFPKCFALFSVSRFHSPINATTYIFKEKYYKLQQQLATINYLFINKGIFAIFDGQFFGDV